MCVCGWELVGTLCTFFCWGVSGTSPQPQTCSSVHIFFSRLCCAVEIMYIKFGTAKLSSFSGHNNKHVPN